MIFLGLAPHNGCRHILRNGLIAILSFVLIVSGIVMYNNYRWTRAISTIEKDYAEFYDSFYSIAKYLSDYDYPIIYAARENIISDGRPQTVNSIVSMELFEKPYTAEVEKLGYYMFEKDGGIYFVKIIGKFREAGIMYYPSGFTKEQDVLVTDFEELSPGWYYYQKE